MIAGVSFHYAIYRYRLVPHFSSFIVETKNQHFQRQKLIKRARPQSTYSHTHLQSVCACIGVWWLWNEFTAMFSDCCIFRTPFREPHHRAIIIRKFHSIFYSFRFFNQHESRTICFLNQNLEKNVSVEVLFSTVNFMFTTKHTRWHKQCEPNAYKAIFMKKPENSWFQGISAHLIFRYDHRIIARFSAS